MGGGALQPGNTTIVSAFHVALLHQLLILVGAAVVVSVACNVVRSVQYRRLVAAGAGSFPTEPAWTGPEPAARRLLRIGFGLLWLFDGLLQIQTSMPVAMPAGVLQPAAAGSPGWVVRMVGAGATIWSNHPVEAAAAAVWVQVGLGIWLLVAPRGRWSRLGGLATVAWGLVVWSFGEAFGGILAPGASWLFGTPGAVLFYAAAGALVALPERSWAGPDLGRRVLGALGAFYLAMAVLQAWPGRGFWQGAAGHRHPAAVGSLTAMVRQMAQTPQPGLLSRWVSAFASFDAAHGWGVNLFVVVALAAVGIGLCSGRPRLTAVAVGVAGVVGAATWVLVQDLGFLGGVGTDPNSMVPLMLLVAAGYVAVVRVPAPAAEPTPVGAVAGPWWERATPAYVLRSAAAVAAVAVVLMGTAPMALAATNPNADPIVSEAANGRPDVLDRPAPPFDLVDQRGRVRTLASFRGHVVAMTFLDPVCTSDCPLIGQVFRQTDLRLGSSAASRVDFVAVVANPDYRSRAFTNAFDREEDLAGVANWYFLTGSVAELRRVWQAYGVEVDQVGAGAMIDHSDLAYVIDARGTEQVLLGADPGQGSETSSLSSLLLQRIDDALRS